MSSNEIVAAGPGERLGLDDSLYNRLLKERIIWLGSEVRDDNANAICSQLLLLSAEDPEKDIYLYINSPGGSVTAGMAIYDTMQFIKPAVSTLCLGQAASMGAVLLAAGAKGKRYALPHGRVMIHQPLGGASGQASDIEIQALEILKVKKVLTGLLAKHCNASPSQVEKDSDRDKFFSAEESKSYGLVDSVIEKHSETQPEKDKK